MRSAEESLRLIQDVVGRTDAVPETEVLAALTALHRLRDELTELEPDLIATARRQGVSWAALAKALGVASRQAAERRYLRLRPAHASDSPDSTADERVQATRDRRAAKRAVDEWARSNSAMLRQLAGNVSSVDALPVLAREQVRRALAGDDSATLLEPLASSAQHLDATDPALAQRVHGVTDATERVRRQTQDRRSRP